MKLEEVQAGQVIKIKMSEGFADCEVINNSPSSKRIALIIKLGVKNGVKYKNWETVLSYNDSLLKDFDLLNNIKVIGNRPLK